MVAAWVPKRAMDVVVLAATTAAVGEATSEAAATLVVNAEL